MKNLKFVPFTYKISSSETQLAGYASNGTIAFAVPLPEQSVKNLSRPTCTCKSVWPGLEHTCVELHSLWLMSNLNASQHMFFTI